MHVIESKAVPFCSYPHASAPVVRLFCMYVTYVWGILALTKIRYVGSLALLDLRTVLGVTRYSQRCNAMQRTCI